MFNIGPLEMVVLAVVGIVVLGPERLPGLARDAARLIRNLREAATGARQQLREELGPEFADVDLRNLNPRTAVQRALLGDDVDLQKYHPRNARNALQDMLLGPDEPNGSAPAVDLEKPVSRPRPRPRPGGATAGPAAGSADPTAPAPYDPDAT